MAHEVNTSQQPLDQRQSIRFELDPDSPNATIFIEPRNKVVGMIEDVSRSGMGLVVEDANPFRVGYQVKVVYQGSPVVGTILNVSQRTDGYWRVGMEWEEPVRLPGRIPDDSALS